jgi:hypothetical protein
MLVCVVFFSFVFAVSHCETDPGFYKEKDIVVPMRDGVKLKANIYRPSKEGKFPVLIFRTPYSKDEGDADNESTFANAVKRGYAVVIQDVRGRYASEGEFVPYFNEGKDGYDTIEWAAMQPWSTGAVGTFGLSYPGAVQWLAAVENPPHLKAMVPAMCFSSMMQCVYFGGIFEMDWIGWAYKWMSPDARVRLDLKGPRSCDESVKEYDRIGDKGLRGYLPTLEMPYLKGVAPYYYDWIRHAPYEKYWDFGDLRMKYGNVHAAVLNISGWYDEPYGPGGATVNYLGLLAARKGQADPQTNIIIGPWCHGVDSTKKSVSGDRKFSSNAELDYDKLVLDWLDRYVKGVNNGISVLKPATIYVMGDNRWIESDSWPVRTTVEFPVYLVPSVNKTNLGSGKPVKTDAVSHYIADPMDPVKDEFATNFGAYDLRKISDRKDVLTFDSEPLTQDLEVVGNIKAEIYLSSDAPDCDIFVKLLDVAPDGTAFNLMSPGMEALRVSYRDRTPDRRLLKPGEVVKLTLDNMMTGNTFLKGHRIRVCMMSSWYPIYSRNLQTGKLESVSAETRKAAINIHEGIKYPSRVVLPVIPKEEQKK